MWMGAFTLAVIFFLLPETSASNILHRRARRLRQATGNLHIKSQAEIDSTYHNTLREQGHVLGRAVVLTFTEPIVLSLDMYTALLYGLLFIWFESFPLVFGDIYHFTIPQQGLVFLGILVGGLITVPLYLLWLRFSIVPRMAANNTAFRPEHLLPPTFLGALALPACLFWYGWTSRDGVPWIVPAIGSSFFTIAIVTLFNPVLYYLGVAYPKDAASVYAGNTLFRATFGAGFPLFVGPLCFLGSRPRVHKG
jgi:MFS transporter, DHA1 family, multidrug resistance protein